MNNKNKSFSDYLFLGMAVFFTFISVICYVIFYSLDFLNYSQEIIYNWCLFGLFLFIGLHSGKLLGIGDTSPFRDIYDQIFFIFIVAGMNAMIPLITFTLDYKFIWLPLLICYLLGLIVVYFILQYYRMKTYLPKVCTYFNAESHLIKKKWRFILLKFRGKKYWKYNTDRGLKKGDIILVRYNPKNTSEFMILGKREFKK